jgi:hypothetical protein
MAVIHWTSAKLKQLRLVYADAVGKGMSQFSFENNPILTVYGPMLINTVDNALKKK